MTSKTISRELRDEWAEKANELYQQGCGTTEELNSDYLQNAFTKINRVGFHRSDQHYRDPAKTGDVEGRIKDSRPTGKDSKTAVIYDYLLKSLPAIQTQQCRSERAPK